MSQASSPPDRYSFNPGLGLLEVLPDSLNIPAGSFKQRDDIQTVTFSDDLDSIDSSAFASCRNLTTLHLPDSLSTIGKEAFYANFSLQRLVVPNGVVSIGDYAFQYGRSLQSVTSVRLSPASGSDLSQMGGC